jgi:hypothetical protein
MLQRIAAKYLWRVKLKGVFTISNTNIYQLGVEARCGIESIIHEYACHYFGL